MNLAEDIIEQGEKLMEETRADEVISKMLSVKKRIEDRPINDWTIDGLVDHVFTLAKIMDNLSDLKDYARLVMEASEEEHDSAVRDTYLSLKESGEKMTDGMAKAKAEQHCESLKRNEIATAYKYHTLNNFYKDCDRLINFTQTKVKSMVDNRVRSNIGN